MLRVSAVIDVLLDATPAAPLPLRARLSYTSADPFAVRAEFFHEVGTLACWHFDRQMLADGLHGPVGEGDARFRPATTGTGRALLMELSGRNPQGPAEAVILADSPAVARFLRQTHALVPPGTEDLDVDAHLEVLLAG